MCSDTISHSLAVFSLDDGNTSNLKTPVAKPRTVFFRIYIFLIDDTIVHFLQRVFKFILFHNRARDCSVIYISCDLATVAVISKHTISDYPHLTAGSSDDEDSDKNDDDDDDDERNMPRQLNVPLSTSLGRSLPMSIPRSFNAKAIKKQHDAEPVVCKYVSKAFTLYGLQYFLAITSNTIIINITAAAA